MIILDTNVFSEPLRLRPDAAVVRWLNSHDRTSYYFTTINLAEGLLGLALLPQGRRKRELTGGFKELLESIFDDRILGFDREAAGIYAEIRAEMHLKGSAISPLDAQIAAIACQHGFAIATRDERPFKQTGLKVINPWMAQPT